MDCCQLALHNANLALRIALSAFGTIALLLLMFFGYNLKLDGRTAKLEKKNGHEQQQINSINSLLDSSNKQINQLKAEIAKLKSKS